MYALVATDQISFLRLAVELKNCINDFEINVKIATPIPEKTHSTHFNPNINSML